jgi:glucokinase
MGAIIAADVGGTRMRVAAFPLDSIEPIKHRVAPTQAPGGSAFARFTAMIEAVWPEGKVEAISLAAPGPLDPATGTILSAPNIPEWINFPLGARLAERFDAPVFVGNDANLALLGEWRYGAGQGHHDLIYITISTGIGGGVICGDRLLLGKRGLAAELGHVTVLPGGPLCSCGQRGHLEAIASGPAIARYVNERLAEGAASRLAPHPEPNARQVAEAARQGDALAQAAYRRAGECLGQALANFLHIFNPSMVIFGGGVSQSGALIFEPLKETLYRQVMDQDFVKDLSLETARLGDDAGLIGALVQAQQKLSGHY